MADRLERSFLVVPATRIKSGELDAKNAENSCSASGD